MHFFFGPLATSLAFWFGLRDWSQQDVFLGPAAALRGCPLERLETTLAMTRGYERLYSRGFDTHDVWALVTALQGQSAPAWPQAEWDWLLAALGGLVVRAGSDSGSGHAFSCVVFPQ